MIKLRFGYIFLLFCCFIYCCTPKTAPAIAETIKITPPPKVEENLSKCPKFTDAPNPGQVEDNYVIYRDFLKRGTYDQAFELWKKVYEVAPAADGKRTTVFDDGIWFYKRIYSGETDEATKAQYEVSILAFFDEIADCYGKPEWVGARKAFEQYYTFGAKDKTAIYNQFKAYIDKDDLKTQAFVFNPFTALLLELHGEGKISNEEAQKYEAKIREIIAHNLATAKPADKEAWEIVDSYAPIRLEEFETTKGFFNCDYISNKYYPIYLENPEDCDNILTVLSRMKFSGCTKESSAKYAEIYSKYASKCVETPEPGPYKLALDCLKNADYNCSIEKLTQAESEATDSNKKAKYNFLKAKIYYAHLKKFSKAREYALKAADQRSGWGEPYLMIGRLYASSGPLCGSGRGWNSQVVTWPAIDVWNKAKSVDPSVTEDANKLIRKYQQYMPSVEDIFQRQLKEGDAFRVPCWIQRNTTVRAAK